MKKFYCVIAVILLFINAYPESYPLYKPYDNSEWITTELSSWGNYPMKGKTFFVISGDPQISNYDVEFLYYRDFITQVLIRAAAIPSLDYDSADVCILLDYGIFDASYVATRSIPVWGKTGISSVRTTTTTSGSVYGSSTSYGSATAYSSGNSTYGYGSGSTYANATGSSTTYTTQNYNYDYGVTGYRQESYNVKKYRAHLNLYAYDNTKKDGEPIMLWKINATCNHSRFTNLRKLFPFMANACVEYTGKDSNGTKKVTQLLASYGDTDAMEEKIYLQKNIIVNPLVNPSRLVYKYEFEGEYKDREFRASWCACQLRAIQLDEDTTYIFLLIRDYGKNQQKKFGKVGGEMLYLDIESYITIGKKTYLKYRGEDYFIEGVISPFYPKAVKLKGDGYEIEKTRCWDIVVLLKFPVRLEKEDNFDFYLWLNYSDSFRYGSLEPLPPVNVTIKQ